VIKPYLYLFRLTILKLRRSAGTIWLLLFILYLAALTGNAMFRTYRTTQETEALQRKHQELLLEKQRLEAVLVYYQSETYKEKELRRALLLRLPNETVYALPESGILQIIEQEKQKNNDTKANLHALPVWRQWLVYLFQGER
jgi:cell division protein FtsB